MLGSFELHLRSQEYSVSLITGADFYGSREALKSKQRNLNQLEKGNKPKPADALDDNDIGKLFEASELGVKTPTSLLSTMWLNYTLHFGIMGSEEEHRNIVWGDISLCYAEELAAEFLEYSRDKQKQELVRI